MYASRLSILFTIYHMQIDEILQIIKTSFEKIRHIILFQIVAIPNGKKLVDACHVSNLEECRYNGLSFIIKAKVFI